ncbi:hypothetical protein HS048_21715 [Planomonospora sp. ID91781]|uniref:Protein-L-isoaspartate O-methyltransferase n=1 Tax=Planomonospora sphaerica TaxID=161355 RepID=A0A171CQ13_9ACTN|nr:MULTISPECIES: hypothetical protein [Planomonospora]MBG0823351.1 hypothetical protein [Planomonospora sp. ID91781]GAT67048.1 protein-L-isoaspartate O-methyltransferase [Planomonospora sphaerica]
MIEAGEPAASSASTQHGRGGADLARMLHDHVHTWDHDRRYGPDLAFTLYPADVTVPSPAVSRILPKRHTHLALSWV